MKPVLRVVMLFVCAAMLLGLGAFASGEASAEAETQVWTTEASPPASSYAAPKGATLAFVPKASVEGNAASVDIYIDGVLYEGVAVKNYSELLALKDASGLNGKKAVVLTGVIEYGDFDGTFVALYDAIGPSDNIVYIPDADTAAMVEQTVKGLFTFGTDYGVDALYTFDHGNGFNGFTATSDTQEKATCLYTGAATGTDGTLAYADGALNTYEPVVVEDMALSEDGIVRCPDGSYEYKNGKALAYATNGGRLTVKHGVLDGASGIFTAGTVNFSGTDFTGSFAAGNNGLWDGEIVIHVK